MPVVINGSNTPTAGGVAIGNGSELQFTPAGTSGQVLVSNGAGAPTWQTGGGTLPSQTGQGGNFLTTDGSVASWAAIASGSSFTATASGAINSGNVVVVNSDGTVSAANPGSIVSYGAAASYAPFGTSVPYADTIALDSANSAAYFYFSYYNGSTTDYYVGRQTYAGSTTTFTGAPWPIMLTLPAGSTYPNPNAMIVVGSNLYVLWAWNDVNAKTSLQKYALTSTSLTFVSEIITVYSSTNYPNRTRMALDTVNNQLVVSTNINSAPQSHYMLTVDLSSFTASSTIDIQSYLTSAGISYFLDFNIAVNPNNGYFVIYGLDFVATYNQLPVSLVIGNSAGLSGSTTITVASNTTVLQPYTKALPPQFLSTDNIIYMSAVDNNPSGNPYYPDIPNYVRAVSITNWATTPVVTWGSPTRVQPVGNGDSFAYSLTATPSRTPYGIEANGSSTNYFDVVVDSASPPNLTVAGGYTVYPNALNTFSNAPYDAVNNKAPWYFIVPGGSGGANGLVISPTVASNITLAGVVGIADSSFSNGATATVKTLGAVSTSQIGLSVPNVYYVNTATGGITTSPGAIRLGKSLSATNLLITL